jgi:bacterioferritin-associated ferredoxin
MSSSLASASPLPHPPTRIAEAMTACECTGRSFAEVAFRMGRDGLTMAEAESLTGCGSICTACIPDLRSFLGRLARPLTIVPKERIP